MEIRPGGGYPDLTPNRGRGRGDPLDRRPEGRLVFLHRQQAVPALAPNESSVLDLAAGRDDRHDGPGQVKGPEQVGDHPDLVRPVQYGHLAEG